jgi:hypothetical protein
MVLQSVLENLDLSGCGYTIDSFKFGANGEQAVQWVVARPVSMGEPESWPPLEGLLEELPDNHNLEFGLTNSSAELPNCPLQPAACIGSHYVASGVGVIA